MGAARRRGVWLGVAGALLVLSAWLMSRGDKEKPAARPPKVAFPRSSTPRESARNQRRRTLPPLPAPTADAEGFRMRRDPMLVALPVDPKRSAMVFELDALKEAPIVKIWIDCLLDEDRRRRGRGGVQGFQERYGVDPLEDVERMAISSDKVILMQGSFDGAHFDPGVWTQRTYGEKGVIYEDPEAGRAVGLWGDDMMIASGQPDSAEPVEDAIDRLESTDARQRSILDEHQAYGDIYGVLSPEDLSEMLPPDQGALADRIREVVEHVEVHIDASEDVAMVADVAGPGEESMEDLAKSLGAALAVGRIKAQNDGDDKLAELLDYARVKQAQGGAFSMDVALPMDVLKDLGPCRRERWERDEDEMPAPAPAR
ncbi:MAG: hypothetical protein IT372_36695 [Polyangiaceae bacterium]|nr:hypothetical protein [Polyangiaceae bacterium]